MSNAQNKPDRRQFLKNASVLGGSVVGAGLLDTSAAAHGAIPDKWEREADVIVGGTGFAGMSAAIAAHDAGAKVVVLEKMEKKYEGGNSKVSGNMWSTPTNLPEAVQYIKALCFGLTDDESIRMLAAEMMKLNDWLATLGIEKRALGIFQPEHPELPGSACVRTWNTVGGTAGAALWTPIREQIDKRSIEVLYQTPARELVQGPTGEILGVVAENEGKRIHIKGKRGVVLCTGGFEFDFEMQKQFLPGWPTYGRGTPANTGDGIRMSQKAGAALWHMNNSLAGMGCMVVPEFAPVMIPVAFPSGAYIFVDKLGRRFMNEGRESRHGFGHKEYMLYFDGVLGDFTRLPWWGLFDESLRVKGNIISGPNRKFGWFGWHGAYEASRDNSKELEKGWIIQGATIPDLAGKLGMKPDDLGDTLTRYNQYCKSQADPDFARSPRSLVAIETPPFYAVRLYPATYNTQGGPKRNARCQIVDPNNQPIPRLFSAGEMGSFWGWMYNGGGNNSEALCTGQVAGKNAAAGKPWR